MDKRGSRNLNTTRAEPQPQAILFRHTIETPCEVRRLGRKIEVCAHPLPSPWPRIKERHHAKGPMTGSLESRTIQLSAYHAGSIRPVCIQQVIDLFEDIVAGSIGSSPVDEIGALV